MSNYNLERQLNLVINLLENLPSRIADEMEKRHEIRKAMQIQAEIEFYSDNQEEINKFMYGFNKSKKEDNKDCYILHKEAKKDNKK